ncbi:MAG: hypothetical protein QXE05_09580 [Nitrososphaeria archaeon]
MDRHEQIKQQCAQILDYYYIASDTEFFLDTKERIDVVGYFRNKNDPDIGIEVELSSGFQHDASKLSKIKSFQWRFIVTDLNDTLSLGPMIQVDGIPIEIVKPPDLDLAFETKIREITDQKSRPWFNTFMHPPTIPLTDPLLEFEREIEDQGLDFEAAKDVLFRAKLGGIHLGEYQLKKYTTEYNGLRPSREMLFLKAKGFIREDMKGRNLEEGKQLIYTLSEEAQEVTESIIAERINTKTKNLQQIVEIYGNSAVMISLLGYNGNFVDPSESRSHNTSVDYYDKASLPSTVYLFNDSTRYLTEKFNIDPEIISIAEVVASSSIFREITKQIYKALVDAQLGNKTESFSARGNLQGELYSVPLSALLEKLEVEEFVESPKIDRLRSYAEWAILQAHNPSYPKSLFDSYRAIGSDPNNAEILIEKLAEQGITSKLVKGGTSTIAIYDIKRFNDFCEWNMSTILQDFLKQD